MGVEQRAEVGCPPPLSSPLFVLLEHPDTPAEIREILVEKFLLVS